MARARSAIRENEQVATLNSAYQISGYISIESMLLLHSINSSKGTTKIELKQTQTRGREGNLHLARSLARSAVLSVKMGWARENHHHPPPAAPAVN